MRVYLQNPPTVRIGGQVTKSLYQFSLHSPDKEELYACRRKAGAGSCQASRADRRHQRPADLHAPGQCEDRPRQGCGDASQRPADRERPLRRLRSPLGLDHLRRGQRIQGPAGAEARVPGGSQGALAALLQGRQWPADPARLLWRTSARKPGRRPSTTTDSCRRSPSRSTSSLVCPWATCRGSIQEIARA